MNRTLHSTFGCRVSLVSRRPSQRRPPSAPCCASSREGTKFKTGEVKYAFAGTLGLLAEAEVARSLKFLSANGCGLPSGAGGVEGLVEGLSYLGVVGIFVASVASYIRTGQGLPTGRPGYQLGPGALLGLAEGVSFLYLAAGTVFLALATAQGGVDALLPPPG